MKSSLLSLSAVVITGLLVTACHKKDEKHPVAAPVTPAGEKVEATEASFVDSLTSGSWVSACDKDQKRARIVFQNGTNVFYTYDESCSRGQKNDEVLPSVFWYEISQFDGEGMQLQISEYEEAKNGQVYFAGKGKAIQAFTVKLDGNHLQLIGLLPDHALGNFPMKYMKAE